MDDIYRNIEQYNSGKECKILIVLNHMIADMLSNKKLNPTVISLAFIAQSYLAVTKNIRLNSTHYFIIKIRNKQEPQ